MSVLDLPRPPDISGMASDPGRALELLAAWAHELHFKAQGAIDTLAREKREALGPVPLPSVTVAELAASPPKYRPGGEPRLVFVSDESGGATLAFSDGAAWRRTSDRAVVS
jgi:hypothetical protein